MTHAIIKSWIYEDIQSKAQQKMRTIVWEKIDGFFFADLTDDDTVYRIEVKDIVKETEKAVCFNCKYWSTRSYRPNFTVYDGYKVWVPKSAILKMA